MAKLNKLAKLVQSAKKNEIAENFLLDLEYSIKKDNERDYIPSKSFKPSGISGCSRSLYYEMIGIQPDVQPESMELLGICESGTDRHEMLQNYIMNMHANGIDCKWLDVGAYLESNGIKDPSVIQRQGNETKLYSSKYNMRYMCDGLLSYKGKHYILEIKTEASFKYSKHDEPYPEHKQQATCYAMTIGVRDVIFLYENRDNCSKKAYLCHVTDEMIERVESIINNVNQCVSSLTVPPMDATKCTYCKYKTQCAKDGK